jgi:hypothetical protein
MVFVSLCTMYCSFALADDNADKQITESVLRETRDIISRELLGSIRFTATYSWKDGKRKDMCCSPGSGSVNNDPAGGRQGGAYPRDIVVFWIVRDSACAECGSELGKGRFLRMRAESTATT